MQLHILRLSFVLACFLLFPLLVQAQSNLNVKIGPRVTVDVADIDRTAIGGTFRVLTGNAPLQASGAFDVYLSEGDATIFTVDVNAHYLINLHQQWFSPYAGLGGGLMRVSGQEGFGSETDLGFNLVGGAEVDLGVVTPFVQSQLTLGSTFDRLGFSAGLLFNF